MSHHSSSDTSPTGAQPVTEDSIKFLEHHLERRPVAKRACLACREKKIKCDGEVQLDASGNNKSYEKCTNCVQAGIECVFVPSRRGGRRRKEYSTDSRTAPQSVTSSSVNDEGSFKRHHFDPSKRFGNFGAPDAHPDMFGRHRHHPGPGRFGSGSNYLPPPFARYEESGKRGDKHGFGYDKRDPKAMYYQEPYFYYDDHHLPAPTLLPPPPPPGLGLPPPPPPLGFPPPPGAFLPHHRFHRMRHHHHRHPHMHHDWFHHHGYGFPYPPPSPGMHSPYPYSDNESRMSSSFSGPGGLKRPAMSSVAPSSPTRIDDNASKHSSSTEDWVKKQKQYHENETSNDDDMSASGSPQPSSESPLILKPSFTEPELARLGLPPWKTIYTVIQLFYKYVHIAYQMLPNLTLFVDRLSLTDEDVAMICIIFRIAARYMNLNEVDNKLFLDDHYWAQQCEKYYQSLSIRSELLLQTMTCDSGDDDQLLRCYSLIKVAGYLEVYKAKTNSEYAEMLEFATEKQLTDRECTIRAIWNVYKFQTFRRLNFGYPYRHKGYLKFPGQLEFPMEDMAYYRSSKWPRLFKKTFKKVLSFSQVNVNDLSTETIPNSVLAILSCYFFDEIMDSIYGNALLPENVVKYDSQLNKMASLPEFKPYTVENNHILVDGNVLLSNFINNLSLITLHSSICWSLLPFRPKDDTNSPSPLLLMNEFPSPFPDQVESSTDERLWRSLVVCLKASCAIASLIQLGEGICAESLSMNTILPVSVGPFSTSDKEDCYSTDDKVVATSSVQPTTEPWVQYPSFCTVSTCQAVPILCSGIFLLSKHEIRIEKLQHGCRVSVLVADEAIASWETDADTGEFISEKWRKNYLLDKLRLLSKFLATTARFSANVTLASTTTDQLIQRLCNNPRDE
ncbi:hypothetical protein OGAPHI_002999 [Ogataea philodendri]|uniref:Zn(2)-C6 fungal-type domain-containing protein n=1 Tax=Ogataea philodendri TaxID=1378263 RepID=A0A9P8P8V7_9ASCO|nr:uncharacterized protein OGAPHI_002999 [Ogataea philodendri]KAH3667350.1 hypothetical protein OGAPHI_002999 [Ogataea philodendri]